MTVPTDDADGQGQPHGLWKSVETVVPDLSLDLSGQSVAVRGTSSARLLGPLRETTVPGDGPTATYEGKPVPAGTRRYRGLTNGDLATLLGKKEATGGVIPEQLFAGDRGTFETSQRQAASGLLISGICSIMLSPIVLVGGLLGAIFWRRR